MYLRLQPSDSEDLSPLCILSWSEPMILASILSLGPLLGASSDELPTFWFPPHSQDPPRSPWSYVLWSALPDSTLGPEPSGAKAGPTAPYPACLGEFCQCRGTESQMSVSCISKEVFAITKFISKMNLTSIKVEQELIIESKMIPLKTDLLQCWDFYHLFSSGPVAYCIYLNFRNHQTTRFLTKIFSNLLLISSPREILLFLI